MNEPTISVSHDEILAILGTKEVEIVKLRQLIGQLQAKIAAQSEEVVNS